MVEDVLSIVTPPGRSKWKINIPDIRAIQIWEYL